MAVAVTSRPVAVAMAVVVGVPVVIPAVTAVRFPRGWALLNASARNPDHREPANRLRRLFPALRTGDGLEYIRHRHALICARPATTANVFVKCHAQIVRCHRLDGQPRYRASR